MTFDRLYKLLQASVRVFLRRPKDFLFTLFSARLSPVNIRPYDSRVQPVARRLIRDLHTIFPKHHVYFFGSSSLKIAGRGDIDLFAICPVSRFPVHLPKLTAFFGPPFRINQDNIKWRFNRGRYPVELVMADPHSREFADQQAVFLPLNQPAILAQYSLLKNSLQGAFELEYCLRRMDFFDTVIASFLA